MQATIIENPQTNHLCEAMQFNEIKFAFVNDVGNDTFQAVHLWMKCREYFNEILMKNHHPELTIGTVHGFHYKHDEFPYDLSATRIAMRFPNKETKKTFIENIEFIHNIERLNGWQLTEIRSVNKPQYNNMVLVIADKAWVSSCILTNLYTLCLKLASLGADHKDFKELTTKFQQAYMPSELMYLKSITDARFTSIMHNLNELRTLPTKYVDGTDEKRSDYTIHGHSGILAVLHQDRTLSKAYRELMDTISKKATLIKTLFGNKTCQEDAKVATAS